ncbi:DUF6443 domain-containing protein [Pedobacter petrophilus]|nr:DUF6443 domain-containing protein [Pedobacter petrophilus]
MNGRSICDVNETIQYFDGLGRPLQTVQVNGSLAGHDLVQPFAYDAFGREAIKYQPYSVWDNKGAYRADAIVNGGQAGYFANPPSGIKSTGTPFALTVFEPSPLNRVQEQGAPGDAWQPVVNSNTGHTIKMEYGTNIDNEVKLWQINSAGNGAVASVYSPGKLYKTISKDENWTSGNAGTTEEFKNSEGRVILKRIWESNDKSLSTYYVYDDLGNLRYVLPPALNAGTDRLSSEITSFDESQIEFLDYMYSYHYDGRKRIIEKKVPGKGWESLVYNKLDQVVYTQDANQQLRHEWSWTKYDAFGRVVLTGLEKNNTMSRATIQNNYIDLMADPIWEERTTSRSDGYTVRTHPMAGEEYENIEYHTVNYYDNYEIEGIPNNESANYRKMIKGLLTAQKIRVLGTNNFLWMVNYYDNEGRLAKIYKQHYLSGNVNTSNYDIITNSYSFVGELTASTKEHHTTGGTTTIADRYEYDHVGRPIASFQSINGQTAVTVSHKVYNELGQLKEKRLHNDVQITGLAYNERGWMTGSTSNEFSMELKYNNGTLPQFNGNIANQIYTNGTSNTFTYSYDKLNRLTESAAANLGESISYDVMGNVTSLSRDGFGTNSYSSYTGNRLNTIIGFTNSNYAYDANGNLISDSEKDITLSYNHLNLPQNISGSQNITYTYDATGNKLAKTSNGNTRNYVNGIEYNGNAIDMIHTEEGIAQNNGGNYSYHYNLSDHLGNVRYTFDIYNGAVRRLQQDDYYAFGLRKASVGGTNKYLYNGKELQEELGQYDYGARFYDPVIARWNVIDPLAEKFYSVNPYNYTDNNPVNNIDPDGMETYYGQEAQDRFRQIQGGYAGGDDDDKKKKKGEPRGYFPTLWNETAKGDPFGNVGRTWRGWLSEDSNLGSDLWNSASNTYWGVASLLDGNTYVDFYENQKAYWSSSPEDKAKADAVAINNMVEGAATTAPLAYAGGGLLSAKKNVNVFNGYGVFGKNGLNVGEYRIDALHENGKGGGGTYLSIKQNKQGGNMVRWDKGRSHNSTTTTNHSTFRFNAFGNVYGSSAQRPVTAPFVFWKYKTK